MRLLTLLVLLLGATTSAPAMAGSSDDPFGDDDDDDDDSPAPPPSPGTPPPAPSSDSDTRLPDDEFDEDQDFGTRKEGQDDARIYRDFVTKMEGKDPDEELLEWERYLKKYPNSLFKSRIQDRMAELNSKMYDVRLGESSESGLLDAGKAELRFAQPILMEPVDPRTKLHLAVQLGFPAYLSLAADYEQQLRRNLSVHGGLHSRYSGMNVEVGARYAAIKSARTNTLVTGILDAHINTNPFFFGLRPQVAFGQRFKVMSGLDVQAEVGADLPFGYGDRFSPYYLGGLNVSLAPSPTLRVFFETTTEIKDPFTSVVDHNLRFNVATIGLKFIARKGANTDRAEIGLDGSLPYLTSYWGYHYGALGVDGDIYFE